MSAKSYTIVHVPNGTVTRLTVSEELARQLIAEYGSEGWRVCRMGDVIVLHSKQGGDVESTPATPPQDPGSTPGTSTNLLYGVKTLSVGRAYAAFEWLREYGLETDDLAEADHCYILLSRLATLERSIVLKQNAAANLEHATAELLHCWKNGIETTSAMWERVSESLDAYWKEVAR